MALTTKIARMVVMAIIMIVGPIINNDHMTKD